MGEQKLASLQQRGEEEVEHFLFGNTDERCVNLDNGRPHLKHERSSVDAVRRRIGFVKGFGNSASLSRAQGWAS